jgi:hypothetical protein
VKEVKKGGEKMIKVKVLDETGHSELEVATIDELKEKVELKDKFVFVDSNYVSTVTLDGITELPREIVVTDSLIGG